jgi:hypothetical protein
MDLISESGRIPNKHGVDGIVVDERVHFLSKVERHDPVVVLSELRCVLCRHVFNEKIEWDERERRGMCYQSSKNNKVGGLRRYIKETETRMRAARRLLEETRQT